jgi:hypothetical protein
MTRRELWTLVYYHSSCEKIFLKKRKFTITSNNHNTNVENHDVAQST